MGTGFGPVKHTAVRTHLLQQLILLQKQKVFLQKIQLSLGVYIINSWKKLWNADIVFLITVTVPDSSLPVCHKLKGQNPILIGGQLPAKILIPGSVIPVGLIIRFFCSLVRSSWVILSFTIISILG